MGSNLSHLLQIQMLQPLDQATFCDLQLKISK
jgi:hypothetical protein